MRSSNVGVESEGSAANGWTSIPGYRLAPDRMQARIRLAMFHQGRLWVLSCGGKNDNPNDPLLHTQVRSVELIGLVFSHFLYRGRTNWKRATIRLGKIWCRLKRIGFH